jgi:hypothetical protein
MLSAKFKTRMMVVAAFLVMGLGLVMLNRGAMLLGSPVTFDTIKTAVVGGPSAATAGATDFKTGKDGVVEVPMTIENATFLPQALSIPADKPVRLIVTRKEDNPCSAQLAAPQLGVLKNLTANGVTTVDLPATKSGTYTLTCGMGMLSGQLVVGGAPGSQTASAPSPLLSAVSSLGLLPMLGLIALLGLGASYYVRRRREQQEAAERAAARSHKRGDTVSPRSASKGQTRARRGEPERYFGFSKAELSTIAVAVVIAAIAGITLGGGLR